MNLLNTIKQSNLVQQLHTLTQEVQQKGVKRYVTNLFFGLNVSDQKHKKSSEIWEQYLQFDQERYRIQRIFMKGAVFFLMGYLIIVFTGQFPFNPYRGTISFLFYQSTLYISIFAFILITFYVMDSSRSCYLVIKKMESFYNHKLNELNTSIDNHTIKQEWDDIKKIASITETVGNFIYYPFVVVFFMLLARHSIFDRYDFPLPLIIIFVFLILCSIYSPLVLRASAEKFRKNMVEQLQDIYENQLKLNGYNQKNRKRLIDDYEYIIANIKEINNGAFSPLSQNPVLRAILIPFGGYGTISVIELFARNNAVGF